MYQINQITNDPLQKQQLVLADGSIVDMTMYFAQMQFSWYLRNLTYNSFVLNNLMITVSPNMLQQFRNQIPFGLACFSANNRQPSLQDDFVSGAASLYVLSQAEVDYYTSFLDGQIR